MITPDPEDPSRVSIATDVHPVNGGALGTHEIFRASVAIEDDRSTIDWQAVTTQSPVRNLRPLIVRHNNQRIVLWQRGDFVTFRDYQMDTVGFIEEG